MYETRYADGRTKLPQENQIAQFTAADALAADRQLFSSPADITFVIVGNVAEDKLVALITRYLGSIKHSDSPLAAGKPLTRATDNASVTVKEQNEPVAQVSQWKRYNSRTNTISVEYAGYQMDDAEYFEMATGTSYYQIELEGNNSPDIDIKVTADGTILK